MAPARIGILPGTGTSHPAPSRAESSGEIALSERKAELVRNLAQLSQCPEASYPPPAWVSALNFVIQSLGS
jgi:hypothetical protein